MNVCDKLMSASDAKVDEVGGMTEKLRALGHKGNQPDSSMNISITRPSLFQERVMVAKTRLSSLMADPSS